jgi:hypothetical protein
MILDEIESRLRRACGKPTEANVPKSVLHEYINLAYEDLADRANLRQSRRRLRFNTDAEHNLYALPADYYAILRVRYADVDDRGGRLRKIGPNDAFFRDTGSDPGRPTAYALWKDEIQFYPFPDDVYTIECFCKVRPPTLVSPDDEPDWLPRPLHHGIVLLARYHYQDIERNDAPKAQNALSIFDLWIRGKIRSARSEDDDLEQAVEVPVLRARITTRVGDISPEQWRTGGI